MAKYKLNMFVTLSTIVVFACTLYLFTKNRSRSPQDTLSTRDVVLEMRDRAASAVIDAKTHFATELNYSADSIERIEEILDAIHKQHEINPIDNDELNRLGLKWGGYIGEVIKRVHEAEWQLDSKAGGPGCLPIVYKKSGESFPVIWCLKRIANGAEDNVWDKFNVLVVNRGSKENAPITYYPDGTVTGLNTAEQIKD